MILLDSIEITFIIIGTILGIAALFGLWILFDKFMLNKYRCKKMYEQLEKDYEYLHSLLIGQDAQYIQRLEIISRTNLLYGDIHATYFRRFKEIRDTQDNLMVEILNELKDLFFEKKYAEFKEYYRNNDHIILYFQKSVDSLNNDLTNLIQPEEDARQKIVSLKEKFRLVKSNFNLKENELSFVYDSFQKIFDKIDNKFNDYDEAVENAKYDEADSIIPPLDKVLNTLNNVINLLPEYLHEINEVIPNRIDKIQSRYNDMIKEGYPVKSFKIEDSLEDLKTRIELSKGKMLNLQVGGISDDIKSYHLLLDELNASFDNEVESKKNFDERHDAVVDQFTALKRSVIAIANNINRYKKVYVIDNFHEEDYKNINDKMNQVQNDKTKLGIYTQAIGKTPYKKLVEKLDEIDRGNQELNAKINDFVAYLSSLKNDSEQAYKIIYQQYIKAKDYRANIRNFQNQKISEKLEPSFEKIFENIDKINSLLSIVPINVAEINKQLTSLTTFSNELYKNIDDLFYTEKNARELIVVCNRDRHKFADVNAILDQAEDFYKAGNFKKAYDYAKNALDNINHKEGLKA